MPKTQVSPEASQAGSLANAATPGNKVGGLSAERPDQYCRLAHGFLYASAQLPQVATLRPSAVLLLGLGPRPFLLTAQGQTLATHAAVVRPLVLRRLDAQACPVVSLNIHPSHPAFLRFGGLAAPGILGLARPDFATHDAALQAFFDQGLTQLQGQALADELMACLATLLPASAPPDPLRPALLAWLRRHPDASLVDLAQGLGVSYHHMSHRFSQAMGLGFRQWRAFARSQRASRRFKQATTLTGIAHEVGYADSAHLSRTWQRAYGLSPSYLRHSKSVQATY